MVDAIQLHSCGCSWFRHCNFCECNILDIKSTKKRWYCAQLVGKYVSFPSTSFKLFNWFYLLVGCGRTQLMLVVCHSSLYLNQDSLGPQNGHKPPQIIYMIDRFLTYPEIFVPLSWHFPWFLLSNILFLFGYRYTVTPLVLYIKEYIAWFNIVQSTDIHTVGKGEYEGFFLWLGGLNTYVEKKNYGLTWGIIDKHPLIQIYEAPKCHWTPGDGNSGSHTGWLRCGNTHVTIMWACLLVDSRLPRLQNVFLYSS